MSIRAEAKFLVEHLLGEAEQMRVCSACEQERGRAQTAPGQAKTHGTCRRHMLMQYGNDEQMAGYVNGLAPEKFAPDLAQHPELIAPDQDAQKALDAEEYRKAMGH